MPYLYFCVCDLIFALSSTCREMRHCLLLVVCFFAALPIGLSFKTEDNATKKFTNSPSCQYKFIETIITTEKYTIPEIHGDVFYLTHTDTYILSHSFSFSLSLSFFLLDTLCKKKSKAVCVRINN